MIKLNLLERFTLLGMLPAEGDFTTIRIVRELREALSLSDKQYAYYDIRASGQVQHDEDGNDLLDDGGNPVLVAEGQIAWKTSKAEEKLDVRIGEKGVDLIVEGLKKLDGEGKLTERHFSLYEMFVENPMLKLVGGKEETAAEDGE